MIMMVTVEMIRAAIRRLGFSNRVLAIHASLRSFGWVKGGADTILDGLLAEGCTVLVPTFSWRFAVPPPPDQRPANNGWVYDRFIGSRAGIGRIFQPEMNELDRANMGALPAAVLHRRERVRGRHPLCSFSAIGPAAEALIAGQTAEDVFAPLKQLVQLDGVVILMGVDLNRLTLLHLAEERAGRTLFRRWANDEQGRTRMVAVGGCSEGFVNLHASLDHLKQTATVGQSEWQIYPAGPLVSAAVSAIRHDPYLTHCSTSDCERCHDAIRGGPTLAGSVTSMEKQRPHMDQLEKRTQRAAETILSNEALTADLNDETAQTLLDWGLALTKHIAQATVDLDDAAAEEQMDRQLKAVRRAMRLINRWIGDFPNIDAETQADHLNQLIEQATIIYGDTFSPPDAQSQTDFIDSTDETPQSLIVRLRQLLEPAAVNAETETQPDPPTPKQE